MKIGSYHSFSQIDKYAYDNVFFVYFHGKFLVGEHFMVLKHPRNDTVISFVLTGVSATSGGIYCCIYSDTNE